MNAHSSCIESPKLYINQGWTSEQINNGIYIQWNRSIKRNKLIHATIGMNLKIILPSKRSYTFTTCPKNSTWLNFNEIIGHLSKSGDRKHVSGCQEQSKGGVGNILKWQKETFGFGACVHYLDCGNVFMVVFMYQNLPSWTF